MELQLWHYAVALGAYALGVSSNIVATVFMHWLHHKTGRWWLVP